MADSPNLSMRAADSKPLAHASALVRLVGWALRADAPQPQYRFPAPRDGDDFASFRSRAAAELSAIAESADKQADAYARFGERSKDALSGARAFLIAYPALASMVPHLFKKKQSDAELLNEEQADSTLLGARSWGIDAHQRMLDLDRGRSSILTARADPEAPLPLPFPQLDKIKPSKLGLIVDIAQFVILAVSSTVAAPIVFPAFAAGYEPRSRSKTLLLLAQSLRLASARIADTNAPTHSTAFEGLLDAREALGAYNRWADDASMRASILSSLALERRARPFGTAFGLVRHPDADWHADAPSTSSTRDLNNRTSVEEALAQSGSDRRLVSRFLSRHSVDPDSSETLIASLADWLREQKTTTYDNWTTGAYAHAAAMAAIDPALSRALYQVIAPAHGLSSHFAAPISNPQEPGTLTVFKNALPIVLAASKQPISTAMGWVDKLEALAAAQAWPTELSKACRPILACAAVELWLCSPGNLECPVPNIDWRGVEAESPRANEMLSAASSACAPIALKLGITPVEFSNAICKAVNGSGGVLLNPTPPRFANPDAASAICAAQLSAAEAVFLKQFISISFDKPAAPSIKRRL